MKSILTASLAILVGATLLTITSSSEDNVKKKKSARLSSGKAKFRSKDLILSDYKISTNRSLFLLFLN